MERAPELVLVGGPNGSGKSTLIAALRDDPNVKLPSVYINADDLQRERSLTDREAQRVASDLRTLTIASRGDLMYETVMSHPSKIGELQRAKTLGYHITLHFIGTENASVNAARVQARVGAGGHDVPRDRIAPRYERTMALAPVAIGYADQAFVFDNTQQGDTGRGLQLQAVLQNNRMTVTVDSPAKWVQTLVEKVNERVREIDTFAESIAKAQQPAPVLARLEDGSTTGPIIAVGKHYALQYDADARMSVLHDRILLGSIASKLAERQVHRIHYREAVAETDGPQPTKTR
jgi:predicted ABC-type ATPase